MYLARPGQVGIRQRNRYLSAHSIYTNTSPFSPTILSYSRSCQANHAIRPWSHLRNTLVPKHSQYHALLTQPPIPLPFTQHKKSHLSTARKARFSGYTTAIDRYKNWSLISIKNTHTYQLPKN